MDHRLTLQDYAKILAEQAEINEAREREEEARFAFFRGEQWDAKIDAPVLIKSTEDWVICPKDVPSWTPAHPPGMRYDPMTDTYVSALTRFDSSTKTRVPVTQEWVDEAVAEIVRLNQEIDGKRRDISTATPNSVTIAALEEADRIWEAVRAASAV
jgi:hypothetical protein